MKIKIYLNDGEDHYFGFDPETAELTMVHEFEFEFSEQEQKMIRGRDAESFILEYVFQETNIGESTPLALAWRGKMLRSLSVGDVVSVGETAYSCESVGWERITTEELQDAIIWNDETNSVL